MPHYNRWPNVDEALPGEEAANLANAIWVDEQPSVGQMDSEYVYMWVDANDNLNIGSLNDAGDSILAMTLNVSVDSGDTGLIGGLL